MADTVGQIGLKSNINRTRTNLVTINNKITDTNKKLGNTGVLNTVGGVVSGAGSTVAGLGLAGTGLFGMTLGATLGLGGLLVGGLLSIGSSIKRNKLNNQLADQTKQYNNWEAYQSVLTDYQSNLEGRDSLLAKYRQNVLDSYNNISGTYGADFANTLRELYYGKNGITDNVTSLLAGQYSTFGDIGSGTIAGWNDSTYRSTLTEDELAYFNTNLSSIENGDITKSIASKLTRALMNGGTTIANEFAKNESDIQLYIESSLREQRNAIEQFALKNGASNLQKLSQDIDYEQKLGSAEAKRGSSGLKGGTTNNNELIAKLDKAISDFHFQMITTASLSNLKSSIENAQINTASQISAQRFQEKQMALQARSNAISAFREITSTENAVGREANQYMANVREDEEEMARIESMLD